MTSVDKIKYSDICAAFLTAYSASKTSLVCCSSVNSSNPEFINFIAGEGGVVDLYANAGISGLRLDVVDELDPTLVRALRKQLKNHTPEQAKELVKETIMKMKEKGEIYDEGSIIGGRKVIGKKRSDR